MSKRTIVVRHAVTTRYTASLRQLCRCDDAGSVGIRDPRPNRQRSRADARRSAVRDSQA